jgi:hypothetical protein
VGAASGPYRQASRLTPAGAEDRVGPALKNPIKTASDQRSFA